MLRQLTKTYDCLLNHLYRRRSKKTSKLRVTDLCEGNSPVTDEFPAQRAGNAEKVLPVDDVIMIVMASENGNIFCVTGY